MPVLIASGLKMIRNCIVSSITSFVEQTLFQALVTVPLFGTALSRVQFPQDTDVLHFQAPVTPDLFSFMPNFSVLILQY